MARVLAISSFVAHGHVGLGAITPALQRLGHEVVALPTVVLSNHPGHRHCAGEATSPTHLGAMLDAIDANGWLGGTHALLTGYLPTRAHVRFAAAAAARLSERNPQAQIYCDPVLGDDPDGLYINEEAATAIHDELLGLADMIFPNRFELELLSGQSVSDTESALEAIAALRARSALATSIPVPPDRLANVLVVAGDGAECRVARENAVPHGTGDLLSALFLGHRLNGGKGSVHLGAAVAGVAAAIAASKGSSELRLAASQSAWADPAPAPVRPL